MTENNYKIIWIITQKVITLQLFLKAIYKTLAKVVIKIVITKFLNTQYMTVNINTTTNIEFNKIAAKENFKHSDSKELKAVIEKTLLDKDIIVVNDRKKAEEIVNPNGGLEIQKSVVAEAIAFLADDTAVSLRLVQYVTYGAFKFIYVVRATNL